MTTGQAYSLCSAGNSVVPQASPSPVTYLAMDLVLGQCSMLRQDWGTGMQLSPAPICTPGAEIPVLLRPEKI